MTQSAYIILGLSEGASKSEIKSAYRELSLKHHPDKNNNSEASTNKFIEIRAAYEALIESSGNQSKSDDVDNKTDETPFWDTYFSSQEFKTYKSNFFNQDYKIEVFKLLEKGEFFTTKAKTTYIATRDCKSLAEIGIKDSKAISEKITQVIIDGIIKFEKMINILEPELNQMLQKLGTSLAEILEEAKNNVENTIKNNELKVLASRLNDSSLFKFAHMLNTASIIREKKFQTSQEDIENLYIRIEDILNTLSNEIGELTSQLYTIKANNNNILQGESLVAALQGAVASQDLDKFFSIAELVNSDTIYANVGRNVKFNVMEAVLSEARDRRIDEEKLLTIVENLVEERNFNTNQYALKFAAQGDFYKVAQYLMNHGSTTNDLSARDLFNYEGTEDHFEAFKWLKEHGIKVKSSTVVEAVCNDKLLSQVPALNNNTNVELAKDFLVRENLASLEEMNTTKQGCDLVASLKNSFGYNSGTLIWSAIRSNVIYNVKLLLDNGAEFDTSIFSSLNYGASPEMLEFILNKIDNFNSLKNPYVNDLNSDKESFLNKIIKSNSIENLETLLSKGMSLYDNTHLSLSKATPEIAALVLNQMQNQQLMSSTSNCYIGSRGNDVQVFGNMHCSKYPYSFNSPEDCKVSELVAEYLGETDKIDWTVCQ